MAWRKYSVNEEFFDSWTPDSAYIMGWIAGDGSLTYGKNAKIYLMGSWKEFDHVCNMRDRMASLHPAKIYKNKTSAVQIGSHRLVAALLKKGFKKENWVVSIPVIPENITKHFVRGYFDADGWCGLRNVRGKGVFSASLTSVAKDLISFVQVWSRERIGAGTLSSYQDRGHPSWSRVWKLDWWGRSAQNFMQLMAPAPEDLRNAVKWNVYNDNAGYPSS